MADNVVPKKFREGVIYLWNGAEIPLHHAKSKAIYQAALQSMDLVEFGEHFDAIRKTTTEPSAWEDSACIIESLFPGCELEIVSLGD